jgi:nitrogen regulatory protein PII
LTEQDEELPSRGERFRHQRHPTYRANEFIVDFLPKLKVELLVNDCGAAQIAEVDQKPHERGMLAMKGVSLVGG